MTRSKMAGLCVCAFMAAALLSVAALARNHVSIAETGGQDSPLSFEKTGRMRFPSHYREWVYLSSGFNMSYNAPSAGVKEPENPVFDNVFVDPASYRVFKQAGVWPDKTVLLLEIRKAQGRGSINQAGHFQGTVNDLEAHVKDEARFPGKWAFFSFQDEKSGALIPRSAACYGCHTEHGAVDSTFVQFYPTLMPIAEAMGKLNQAYMKGAGPHASVPAK